MTGKSIGGAVLKRQRCRWEAMSAVRHGDRRRSGQSVVRPRALTQAEWRGVRSGEGCSRRHCSCGRQSTGFMHVGGWPVQSE